MLDVLARTAPADVPSPDWWPPSPRMTTTCIAGRFIIPFHPLRTREAVIFGVTHGAVRKEIGDPKGS